MTDNIISQIPEGGTLSQSAPHADSRDMEFRADGSLLEGDDGGITLRTNPSSNAGDWFSLCGNMQVFESHNVAYEPLFRSVIFGNQDTGTIFGALGLSNTSETLSLADGNVVMTDFKSDPDRIYFYYGFQHLNVFYRTTFSKKDLRVLEFNKIMWPMVTGDLVWGDFVSVAAMNPADQSQIAIAVSREPETLNRVYNEIIFTRDRGENWRKPFVTPLQFSISTMAWSGDGSFLFIVDALRNVARCRFGGTFPFCSLLGNVGAGFNFFMRDMAVDPSDSSRLFLAAVRGQSDFRFPAVFTSLNGGFTWFDITGPDSLLDQAPLGGAVAYIENTVLERGELVSTVAVGTSRGVLIPDGGLGLGWKLLATGLPTVTVMDMVYEPEDDTLVVATLGRGVWFLPGASAAVLGIASPSWTTEMITEHPTLEFDSIRDHAVESFESPPDDAIGFQDIGPSL